ncbi:hypothetical protein JR065_11055 [Xanthomonas sp. AmX2]|uniref:hypothetical protein n=1 Tax=Xanthomonas sp. TaxID=29446 RepID=UPI00197D157C|nr:hypothetical protein [Xanthomonas sp.]MBN6150881.1 hypothetical protein [Xanthomonas sp.]
MRRPLLAVAGILIVAALAGGYFYLRKEPQAGGSARHANARSAADAVPLAATPREAGAADGLADGGPGNASVMTSASARQAPVGPAAARDSSTLSAISEANMKRVGAMQADLGGGESLFKDLHALHQMEGRDAEWSPQVEANLDTHLRSNADAYGGLEVSAPTCSKTLCYMSAVVKPGVSPKAANADWQTLVTSAYGEPWFRDSFSDAHTVLGGDANGTIYISVFLRK